MKNQKKRKKFGAKNMQKIIKNIENKQKIEEKNKKKFLS